MKTGIPIPRVLIRDHVIIHEILTRRDPGHLEELLAAHAGATGSAPSRAVYEQHMDLLRDFAARHHLAVSGLRGCLWQIHRGTFSATWPLVRTTE